MLLLWPSLPPNLYMHSHLNLQDLYVCNMDRSKSFARFSIKNSFTASQFLHRWTAPTPLKVPFSLLPSRVVSAILNVSTIYSRATEYSSFFISPVHKIAWRTNSAGLDIVEFIEGFKFTVINTVNEMSVCLIYLFALLMSYNISSKVALFNVSLQCV